MVSKPSPGIPELKPGDEVVATGSLILEQMYEDRVMVAGEFLSTQPELDEKISPVNPTTRRSPSSRDPPIDHLTLKVANQEILEPRMKHV